MKRTNILTSLRVAVFLLVAFLLAASSSFAVDLAAVEAEWIPPDSATPVPMWGFVPDPGACPDPADPAIAWDVGPEQVIAAGGSLTVTLRNCLIEPVSIVIPGQAMPGGGLAPVWTDGSAGPRTALNQRVRSFSHETPAGGTATYTWNNLKNGTFLYQSGTHPARQVQMGLYGALKVGSYSEATQEAILLFSEIDPALHDPPSTALPLNYKPKYYLINGQSFSKGQPVPEIDAGQAEKTTMLIRFLNAGLMTRIPLLHGAHLQIVAEDGNRYPYAQSRYAVMLAAGKTMDALWSPANGGTHALYDRRLALTSNGAAGGGMLVNLDVANADVVIPPEAAFPWPMFIPAITGAGRK